MQPRLLVIACGALAREVAALKRANGWTTLDVACLPPELHNRPEGIAPAVRAKIQEHRADYAGIFVAYGECGTKGALDAVLAEEGVERIPGAHCYEFFATPSTFAALADAEPGTFYLTDFLLRHFDRLVIRALGIDRHPELLADVFRELPPPRLPRAGAEAGVGSRGARDRRAPRPRMRGADDRLRRPRHEPRRICRAPVDALVASLSVISWRDIPAQVVVRRGRETAKAKLSDRFQEAVDRAAMRAGKGSSDLYLAEWKRSSATPCSDDIEREAAAEAARIEARYTDADLERLVRAQGVDESKAPA